VGLEYWESGGLLEDLFYPELSYAHGSLLLGPGFFYENRLTQTRSLDSNNSVALSQSGETLVCLEKILGTPSGTSTLMPMSSLASRGLECS